LSSNESFESQKRVGERRRERAVAAGETCKRIVLLSEPHTENSLFVLIPVQPTVQVYSKSERSDLPKTLNDGDGPSLVGSNKEHKSRAVGAVRR
jgi:hypothetical protein